MNISFVILHYQNYADTKNCIDSLLKCKIPDSVNLSIILIDNASPNKSGEKLFNEYKNNQMFKIILLDKNIGFSRANNIGYQYARNNEAETIVMLNNDIEFINKDFLVNLIKTVKKNSAQVIYPDIINLKNRHQNPMRDKPLGKSSALKAIIFRILAIILLKIPLTKKTFYNANKKRNIKWEEKYYKEKRSIGEKTVPYGAFLIYTSSWINKETIAFPSKTFMYMEEDYLKKYSLKKGYEFYFDDTLVVKHLEGRATDANNKDKYTKEALKYWNQLKALTKYLFA